jgi:hypothetical protein
MADDRHIHAGSKSGYMQERKGEDKDERAHDTGMQKRGKKKNASTGASTA